MNLQSDFVPLLAEPTPVIKSDARIQLIFDVETLLLDPMPGIADSVGWAMIEQGLAPTIDEMEEAGIGRRPISQVLSTLLGTEDTRVIADATARYHSYFNDSGRFRCRIRESGVRLAQVLARDSRFELHYLTHIGSRNTHKILHHYGLSQMTLSVVTLEHATCPGIRSPLMKIMVEQSASAARNWVLLTDHPWELMAAHQIGMRSIGLAYGRSDVASLCALEPDAIATDPAEIHDLLRCMLPISLEPMTLLRSLAVH
ncbi:HAD family hydrolase [Stenotrophobium rhamnosiphilum]|uniref:HAD family hydrolase n=1 Tax=Stenotrophobium rhamnosiphilum TaxID=2029166 RepID=A0A2T5MKG0_9GAMM|nr:hypothetical protein [Stenotrophobium rhamnosiphilum]PTU33073.1 hypothetical protein CJD38_02920 [Stenotrophobium rhamnosiphilum]